MRELILGTAGHVDHGKTSLIRALTGIDTDRLQEEKKRGITIELGFAFLDLPSGHRLGIVDVPGHEKFVKNMVAGASGIDLVAFVIAADEGVMQQTREHFEICSLLDVRKGVVIITKIDMVDPEWLDLVEEDIRDFFADSFLAEAPVLKVSSTTGKGIDAVKDSLDKLVADYSFTETFGPFRLPIDRVFSMKGFGAVVTGTSMSGRLRIGEDVAFYPGTLSGKVRGIQIHSEEVEEVEAGIRTAINIQGVDKNDIDRGQILATPGCLEPTYMFDADFRYLASNTKKLKNRRRVRIHLGTAEIMGRVVLLDEEELIPGQPANVQILLESPVGVWPGDRYVVRSYSPVYTMGGGEILNNAPAKRRRFRQENRRAFEVYHNGSAEEILLYHLQAAGPAGLTLDQLCIRLGIFGKKMKKLLDGPISARKVLIVDSEKQLMVEVGIYEEMRRKTCEALAGFHENNPLKAGIGKEELRSRVYSRLDSKFFNALLADLARQGEIETDEAVIKLAGHKVSMGGDVEKLRNDMESFYRQAGLNTPTIKELYREFPEVAEKDLREMLSVLVREGNITKVKDDLYFHARVLDELVSRVVDFLKQEGEIDAQKFKAMTGLSRKFSIPLLEYMDKAKITLRIGDKRILREKKG